MSNYTILEKKIDVILEWLAGGDVKVIREKAKELLDKTDRDRTKVLSKETEKLKVYVNNTKLMEEFSFRTRPEDLHVVIVESKTARRLKKDKTKNNNVWGDMKYDR